MTIELDAARRWLEAAKAQAIKARNLADIEGRSGPLAGALDRAFVEAPDARGLEDLGAQREITARDPVLGASIAGTFAWPAETEAELRAEIAQAQIILAKRTVGLSQWLERFHSPDPSVRGEARDIGLPILRPLAERLVRLANNMIPAKVVAPPTASPMASTAGGILLPSAGLIEQIALGIFDPAALTPPPPAAPAAPSSSAGELGDLAQALIEALLRSAPEDFFAVHAARASADRADFRPRPLPVLSGLGSVRALPFGQPGVPWVRPGAAVFPGHDAHRTIAHLFSAGALAGPWSLGGALAFTAATSAFVERGLTEVPSDPLAARRALALAVTLTGLEHELGARAEGQPEALITAYASQLGISPSRSLATSFAAEHGLAFAPGEDRALYPRSGAPMRTAFGLGAPAAERLRERFDEDWWRNPRASREAILDTLVGIEAVPGSERAWLKGAAAL